METILTAGDPVPSHPDWFHLRECLRERRFDGRWTTEVIAAYRDGELVGALPISTCRGNVIPDANIRLEVHRQAPAIPKAIDPKTVMFLGGLAFLRGGVCLSPAITAGESGAITAALTRSGLDTARARSRVPCALFLPDDQLAPMAAAWQPPPQIRQAPPIAFLAIEPCADLDAFAATLPGPARHNWRSDKTCLEAAGISAITVKITEDLLTEAAPGIAAIKIANGVADHPRLTAMRLRNWLSGLDLSLALAWTVRDRYETLLGISVGVVDRRVLRMVEIGLVPSHPSRREIQIELALRAPARACLEAGLTGVDLGPGCLPPKQRRGAVLSRQWHLL